MPYCSIEEAWGTSFYEPKTEPKKFKKMVPEYANPGDLGYFEVEYPESNVYNKNAKSIYCGKSEKKVNKRKSFSRTYNRLSEQSGPSTRFPKKYSRKQKRLVINKDNNKVLVDQEESPNYSNMDLPIDQYDMDLEQRLNDEENGKQLINNAPTSYNIDSESDSDSEEEKETEKESFTNKKENYVNFIIKENSRLKKIINNYQNNKNDNDGIFDLVLFIACGVFIIFLLDTVSKGIRRF